MPDTNAEFYVPGKLVADWLVENGDIRRLFVEKIRTERTLFFFEQPPAELLSHSSRSTFTLDDKQSVRWRDFTAQFGYMSGAQWMCVCSIAYQLLRSLADMGVIED